MWGVEQAERLVKEIATANMNGEPQYMLGNIFVWRRQAYDHGEGEVLDGLQRLTTLQLILAGLL